MKYYKIKKVADNKPLKTKGWYLIANELFTEKEFAKIELTQNLNKYEYADLVEINKFNTYKMFGARFEAKWKQIK